MKIAVGDFIKCSYAGGYWYGWILSVEFRHRSAASSGRIATIWRPGMPVEIMTFPLDSFYEYELMEHSA